MGEIDVVLIYTTAAMAGNDARLLFSPTTNNDTQITIITAMKSNAMPAANVDAYIAGFPPATQKLLQQLRAAIKKAAPKAEELISYGMPAYKYHGVLVYFGGYERHIGFYPTASGIENFKEEIAGFKKFKRCCSVSAWQTPSTSINNSDGKIQGTAKPGKGKPSAKKEKIACLIFPVVARNALSGTTIAAFLAPLRPLRETSSTHFYISLLFYARSNHGGATIAAFLAPLRSLRETSSAYFYISLLFYARSDHGGATIAAFLAPLRSLRETSSTQSTP